MEGLSIETGHAVCHATLTMIELSNYLLDKRGHKVVYLQSFNSDPLEGRFSRYRQLGGACYYMSVDQFLAAEKKIRIQSLVKFNGLTMKEVMEIMKPCPENHKREVEETVNKLLMHEGTAWQLDKFKEQFKKSKTHDGVNFYIAGYISYRLLQPRATKCKACHTLLVHHSKTPLKMPEFSASCRDASTDGQAAESAGWQKMENCKEKFLQMVNRGGIATPSDLVYTLFSYGVHIHSNLMACPETKKIFLESHHHREVFITLTSRLLDDDTLLSESLKQHCSKGHPFRIFYRPILWRLFNTLSVNTTKRVNDQIHADRKRKEAKGNGNASTKAPQRTPEDRKIAKLSCQD